MDEPPALDFRERSDSRRTGMNSTRSNITRRTRFSRLAEQFGVNGIREVLSQETDDGPDFFRAVDTIKNEPNVNGRSKRSNRRRSSPRPFRKPTPDRSATRSTSLIGQMTSPRDAEPIQAAIKGETPIKIASLPKPSSNK